MIQRLPINWQGTVTYTSTLSDRLLISAGFGVLTTRWTVEPAGFAVREVVRPAEGTGEGDGRFLQHTQRQSGCGVQHHLRTELAATDTNPRGTIRQSGRAVRILARPRLRQPIIVRRKWLRLLVTKPFFGPAIPHPTAHKTRGGDPGPRGGRLEGRR